MKQTLFAAVCALAMILAVPHASADVLGIGDSHYIGYIDPNAPSNPGQEIDYITTLIGLSVSGQYDEDTSPPAGAVAATIVRAAVWYCLAGFRHSTGII